MLTFTRVSTQHIGEVMSDPEIALALILDRGFDLDDQHSTDAILHLLERRWQGREQTYGFEHYSSIAQLVLLDIEPRESIALLFSGGKQSSIENEGKPLRVLSPEEVKRISSALSSIDLIQLQHNWMDKDKIRPVYPDVKNEDIDTFWMLFPGVVTFFNRATSEKECVICSWLAP